MSQESLSWVKINKEYLALVPRLSSDQYKSLKNSIKQDGLQVPIIVNQDGEILDGQSTITIRDDAYEIAAADAKSEHRSVANYIQHLIAQEREWKEKIAKLREEFQNGTH